MKITRILTSMIALTLLSIVMTQPARAAISEKEAMAQPRNVSLNRMFAIEQLAANNLDVALAASVRVIRAAPADLEARLLRAQILIVMGRGKQALGDLQTMAKLPLPAKQLTRINGMLKRLDKSQARLKLKAYIQLGYKNTDNANSYPNSGEVEFVAFGRVRMLDYTDIINNQTAKLSDDISSVTFGFSGQYKYSNNIRDYIYFSARTTKNDGSETVQSDSDLTAASIGLRISRGANDFDFGFGATTIDNINSAFIAGRKEPVNVNSDVDLLAWNGTYTRRLQQGTRLFYNVSLSELDHKKTTTADLYDSDKTAHTIGVLAPIGKALFLRASASTAERRADGSSDNAIALTSRDTTSYSATIYWKPFLGHTVSGFYTYSDSDYLKKVRTNPRLRKDESNVYGVNYALQGDAIHERLDNWKLNASYVVRETDSNLAIYDVESKTFGFTIERHWEF